MTLRQAIEIVKAYQKWRRGEIDNYETKPVSIGQAIDILIKNAENGSKRKRKIARKSKK